MKMSTVKNLQEIKAMLPTHELVILTKLCNDRARIADF